MTSSPPPPRARRTVTLLGTCQALLFTNNSILISLGALAGYALAADKRLATLPITAGVAGGALTTFFASLFMERIGRRGGFAVGVLFGAAGAAVSALGLVLGSFWTFSAGALLLGAYNAFGGYYRFAAAEAVGAGEKARAISLVMVGGLVGGALGPWSTRHTAKVLATPFLGAYLSLFVLLALALAALFFVRIPKPEASEQSEPVRPIGAIVSEPVFVVAALAAAFGYGVMSLLMTATPLAMGTCGHPYDSATTVISSHVVAMFAPSFVTGRLIQRFGVIAVMHAGVALNLGCIGIALAGIDVPHFFGALVLLGVGWNFLFVGGTTLLAESVRPAERARAQGMNDLFIFLTMAASSFSAGVIVEADGWRTLNLVAIPFVLAVGVALLWLSARRGRGEATT